MLRTFAAISCLTVSQLDALPTSSNSRPFYVSFAVSETPFPGKKKKLWNIWLVEYNRIITNLIQLIYELIFKVFFFWFTECVFFNECSWLDLKIISYYFFFFCSYTKIKLSQHIRPETIFDQGWSDQKEIMKFYKNRVTDLYKR